MGTEFQSHYLRNDLASAKPRCLIGGRGSDEEETEELLQEGLVAAAGGGFGGLSAAGEGRDEPHNALGGRVALPDVEEGS